MSGKASMGSRSPPKSLCSGAAVIWAKRYLPLWDQDDRKGKNDSKASQVPNENIP